jgi:hypothetical protein
MIDEKETHLCKDIKKQQKEIDRLIDEKKKEEKISSKRKKDKKSNEHHVRSSRQSSLNLSNSVDKKSSHDDKEDEKKKKQKEIQKKEEIIYKDAIEISINGTQKYLKDEMINFQKLVNQQQNNINAFTAESNLKQKIEKKEMEKFIQGQLVTKPDLSFEAEIKEELRLEKEKQREEEIKRRTDSFGIHPSNTTIKRPKTKTSMKFNLVSREMLKEIYKNKKYKTQINNELSFMTDLSLSNIDNSIDDKIDVSIDNSLSDGTNSINNANVKKKLIILFLMRILLLLIRNLIFMMKIKFIMMLLLEDLMHFYQKFYN